jgi:hypothetical protein
MKSTKQSCTTVKEHKVYTKVTIFKAKDVESIDAILVNCFKHGSHIRSAYIVEREKGVALVIHHEGEEI